MLFHQNAARFVLAAVLRMIVPKLTATSGLRSALATSLLATSLKDRNCNVKEMGSERRKSATERATLRVHQFNNN
jgi:hypothetical protein